MFEKQRFESVCTAAWSDQTILPWRYGKPRTCKNFRWTVNDKIGLCAGRSEAWHTSDVFWQALGWSQLIREIRTSLSLKSGQFVHEGHPLLTFNRTYWSVIDTSVIFSIFVYLLEGTDTLSKFSSSLREKLLFIFLLEFLYIHALHNWICPNRTEIR